MPVSPKALVFQHVDYESPGRLGEIMLQNGFEIHTVNLGSGDPVPQKTDDFSILVVMGGPMGVYDGDKHGWLAPEIRFVGEFVKSGKAVMGICLGAQILATALGAGVFKGSSKEIGWHDIELTDEATDDPVFSSFCRTEKVFQWHGDGFETPRGAVNLAFSSDFPSQAFRYGKAAYALQFHIETDSQMVCDWLGREGQKREIELASLSAERIERGIGLYGDRMKSLADSVFSAFLKLA